MTESVHFGLVELDLLATHAGVPVPYPLRVPSFGRIAAEREVLLAAAGSTLRARGLADGLGPVRIAAELVTALRAYRGTVDLVLVGPEVSVGVVAVVYRSWALICGQSLRDDDPAGTVWIRRVAQTALADELFGLVPTLAPAPSMPVTLPPEPVDPDLLDQLGGLLTPLGGRGQLGATRRAGLSPSRAGAELSWLDGPRGRVRVDRAADGWVSVNPLRQNDFRYALDEFATIARGEHHGSGTVARAV